jgi:hypothetical protein
MNYVVTLFWGCDYRRGQLNYSAISSQPPLQSSTELLTLN